MTNFYASLLRQTASRTTQTNADLTSPSLSTRTLGRVIATEEIVKWSYATKGIPNTVPGISGQSSQVQYLGQAGVKVH